MADRHDKNWTTRDEMNYITGIGEHMTITPKLSRRESAAMQDKTTALFIQHKAAILRKYIKSIPLRSNWGVVVKKEVVAFAASEIARLESGA